MDKIIYPSHYRIIWREVNPESRYWEFLKPRVFFNPLNLPIEGDIERAFGTTKKKIVVELFRINMGKPGYYLADLLERKYYYCGSEWEDVRTTLLSLGIGRVDPTKS
ncbi:hypothetical protein G7B40_004610 [Aetokthonos hydrillicola Thurmond2011]|jgi:hypothetical protein|uniref:Uncharacterized protein n=1 Tax=Aetokthonos hydrillicola Thurmond2011 TaxID=2712845 RepID=A0AAP5M3J4_9CYAN|nr:hypothetical protein [Aetokthonos hydrillicola]MBO3458353.1 hypothetical protein [Aetokthonos hydrillicola CCALA 1050]MBW4585918.1 hypothetical protein [Aetokthonos hydrillicola CCALA 1050]MDR9893856.1 hypothetical protein [Aetokthonos hydrillicola Thurmond2011]